MNSQLFATQGFALFERVLSAAQCDTLAEQFANVAMGSKGTRSLLSHGWCADLTTILRQQPSLAALIPSSFMAVQCTYFEKSSANNWLVAIHQDLSIPVAQRVDHPDLKGWPKKEDTLYVQAPQSLLEQLVAVRVHLDDCAVSDGPLRVVPGSHLHGLLTPEEAVALRQAGTEVACTAPRGGALVLRPLLLHASSKSTGLSQRRVLHYLFGPSQLPLGLKWRCELATSCA